MVGFTAWSSVREPGQVFSLLETVYHSFDQIAKRRRVFKVETGKKANMVLTEIVFFESIDSDKWSIILYFQLVTAMLLLQVFLCPESNTPL